MTNAELNEQELSLNNTARTLLADSGLENTLSQFGKMEIVGSLVAGLMVKPDIDLVVYTEEKPNVTAVVGLAPKLYELLHGLYRLEFYDNKHHGADGVCYLGAQVQREDMDWQIDITFCRPQDSYFDSRIKAWVKAMTDEQRLTILGLKNQLIEQDRYKGASSKPPQSFRSVNVYEAVFEGGAQSISDLENYFT